MKASEQGGKQGQFISFSQSIIQCENKKSWLSFAVLPLSLSELIPIVSRLGGLHIFYEKILHNVQLIVYFIH